LSLKLIDAKNLKKSFGEFTAVDNIDLNVQRGEVVGFLGPNGAGKSTTMKMLTGFLEPDSGDILINNIDLKSEPLKAKEFIGYLPEGAPSYSDMEVSEFLSFIGKMRGINNNQLLNARLDEMANQINLKEVWNKPIETLSKGFKRRVGIAQALIHDPDILILDEPTDGLDPNQKHEMRNLIKTISSNKAIVISTHILEEVEAVCSRVIIIANGKLLANETPESLGNNLMQNNILSITTTSKINNATLKNIKSTLNYSNIKLEPLSKTSSKILINGKDKTIDLNKIVTQLKKHKITVTEAGLLKPNLDEIFRKITQDKKIID
jgi:ABC-2 type transport system ATP-binding protein